MNIIQSKDHRIETYGNNKVSLSTKYIFKTMYMMNWLIS